MSGTGLRLADRSPVEAFVEEGAVFDPITVPFDVVMLFNVVKLKEGVDIEEIELALGEMCNVVKNTYGDEEGGFIAGQCFRYAGVVSEEGSIGSSKTRKITLPSSHIGNRSISTSVHMPITHSMRNSACSSSTARRRMRSATN